MTEVRKKDGQFEGFEPRKIARGILSASTRAGGGNELLAEELAAVATMVLEREYAAAAPSTRDIRTVVERVLMETGFVDVAREFILHGDRDVPQVDADGARTTDGLEVVSSGREWCRPFDRARIASDLVFEAGLAAGAAERTARRVEERVLQWAQRRVATSALEDLVGVELRGQEGGEAASAFGRIGLSRRELQRRLVEPSSSPDVESEVGRAVLRRFSLDVLVDGAASDAHLAGELELDALGHPTRALAASLTCGGKAANTSSSGVVLGLVGLAERLTHAVSGPLTLTHPERAFVGSWSSEEEARDAARQLVVALAALTSSRTSAASVGLTLGLELSEEGRRRAFRHGGSPDAAAACVHAFVEGVLDQACELGQALKAPRLALVPPMRALAPSLERVLQRAVEGGLVDLLPPEATPHPLRLVGARVGVNASRVALRCGRRRTAEFLGALREATQRAVAAGARRVRTLIDLDEAGVGPLRRVRAAVQAVSGAVRIDLPGDHGYHASIVPVGLDAAILALTERDDGAEVESLKQASLELMASALPASGRDEVRFVLSDEPFARAEHRLGRADFHAFPRGRDVLRLSHDGEAYRYVPDGRVEDREPRVLDPAVDGRGEPVAEDVTAPPHEGPR